jgi:hypothetical protein
MTAVRWTPDARTPSDARGTPATTPRRRRAESTVDSLRRIETHISAPERPWLPAKEPHLLGDRRPSRRLSAARSAGGVGRQHRRRLARQWRRCGRSSEPKRRSSREILVRSGFHRCLEASLRRLEAPCLLAFRSGWRDLNPRPHAPKASALPSCATPRPPSDQSTGRPGWTSSAPPPRPHPPVRYRRAGPAPGPRA